MRQPVALVESARRHHVGRPHALHLMTTGPTLVPATAAHDERLVWIGVDDRGIELEIVALVLSDAAVVIRVTPTAVRSLP